MSGWQVQPAVLVQAATFIGGNYFGYSTVGATANNLIVSVVAGTANVTDPAGNIALPGVTTYEEVSPGEFIAFNISGLGVTYYTSTSESAGWTSANASVSGDFNGDLILASKSLIELNGNAVIFYNGISPAGQSQGFVLSADAVGRGQITDPNSLVRNITRSTSQPTGNSIGNTATAADLYSGVFRTSSDMAAGDEIRIRSPFNVTMGQTTAETFSVGYSLDGGTTVNLLTIGAAIVGTGVSYSGNFVLCMKVVTTGSGGTAQFWLEGTAQGHVNLGFSGQGTGINSTVLAPVSFDTTAEHTLMLVGQWGGAGGSDQTFNSMGATFTAY